MIYCSNLTSQCQGTAPKCKFVLRGKILTPVTAGPLSIIALVKKDAEQIQQQVCILQRTLFDDKKRGRKE